MTINKKNYLILFLAIVTAGLFYHLIIGALGFSKCWGTWRQISFSLVNVVLYYIPAASLMYYYQRQQQASLEDAKRKAGL